MIRVVLYSSAVVFAIIVIIDIALNYKDTILAIVAALGIAFLAGALMELIYPTDKWHPRSDNLFAFLDEKKGEDDVE